MNHKVTGSDQIQKNMIRSNRKGLLYIFIYFFYLYQYAIIYIYSHIIPKNGSDLIFVLPHFFVFSWFVALVKPQWRRSWCGGISCGGATKHPPVGHPKLVVNSKGIPSKNHRHVQVKESYRGCFAGNNSPTAQFPSFLDNLPRVVILPEFFRVGLHSQKPGAEVTRLH